MKTLRNRSALPPWTALLATCAVGVATGLAAPVNVGVSLHAAGGTTATVGAPAASSSAALSSAAAFNTNANPAGVIGAATLNSAATIHSSATAAHMHMAAANAGTSSNGSVTTVADTPGWSPAFDTSESIGMRRARLTATAQAKTTETTRIASANTASAAVAPGNYTVNVETTAHAIRTASIDTRAQMAEQVSTSMKASEQAMVNAKAQAKDLDDDAKARFKASVKTVKATEKKLNTDLKAAEKASADEWDSARAQVESDYTAYSQAVAQARQISVSGSASGSSSTVIDKR